MSEVRLGNVPRQLVVFRLGPTHYALDIEVVDEILPILPITALPGAPGGVAGMVDVRKRVVPVFDLHWKFGAAVEPENTERRLILVETLGGEVALLVDAVEEVLTVAREDFQPVEAPGNREALDYLSGVVRSQERLLLWIDHERVVPAGALAVAKAA